MAYGDAHHARAGLSTSIQVLLVLVQSLESRGPVIVVGLGELGSWFAHGLLRAGHPVIPVTRSMSFSQEQRGRAPGTPLLVAVPEAQLPAVLAQVEPDRRGDVMLVQNATFRGDALLQGWPDVTWAMVWTLRKKGMPQLVGQPTVLWGPHAETLRDAQQQVGMPTLVAGSSLELDQWLATKFAFILTISAMSLAGATTLGDAMDRHSDAVEAWIMEGLALASVRLDDLLPVEPARQRIREGLHNMRAMPTGGRAAAGRIVAALELAGAHGIDAPALRRLALPS